MVSLLLTLDLGYALVLYQGCYCLFWDHICYQYHLPCYRTFVAFVGFRYKCLGLGIFSIIFSFNIIAEAKMQVFPSVEKNPLSESQSFYS